MSNCKKDVEETLEKYQQKHLLQFYNEISQEQQQLLLNQLKQINFEKIQNIYHETKKKLDYSNVKIEPMEYIDKYKMEEQDQKECEKIGEQAIRSGKLAVITMAGGQGTRLGHHGPKGTYDIGLKTHKVIFEILCDKLKMAHKKYQIWIPWYIMTSKENNTQTVTFFKQHNYFGYPKEKIKFFKQGECPMLDQKGKLLLNQKWEVKEAPDGHGGVFEAIIKNNILKELNEQKIAWVFIGGVDNVLLNMIDPLQIGLAIKNKAQVVNKSVAKNAPDEKVGVFCRKNGKPSVVEYIEISEEMTKMKDEQGELLYGEANIICHLINTEILEALSKNELPYHIAYKKASYIDNTGNTVQPESSNAYKFEKFIFDAFENAEKVMILRVKREEEFAPVKNKEGKDSPQTARQLYENYYQEKN